MTKHAAIAFALSVIGFLFLYLFLSNTTLISRSTDSTKPSSQQTKKDASPEEKDREIYTQKTTAFTEEIESNTPVSTDTHKVENTQKKTENAVWAFTGTSWEHSGSAPLCSDPFVLQTPVEMTHVSEALWPGQVRGADYKGHGGFRFSKSLAGNVEVVAPLSGHLIQASHYLEGGVEQYLLFVSVPCGYVYRLDHIRTLSPKIAQALSFLPEATEGDSRTSFLPSPLWIEQGDLLATQVGIAPANFFIDFGLYDVRRKNGVTPETSWADKYESDVEFGHYGVCFFDFLPDNQGEIMRSLPTGIEGKKSDYCQ